MFDIDDNLWLAESVYKNVSNDFLKTREAKLRKNTLPWMNSKIRKLMNKRCKALIMTQISRDSADWSVYSRRIFINILHLYGTRGEY